MTLPIKNDNVASSNLIADKMLTIILHFLYKKNDINRELDTQVCNAAKWRPGVVYIAMILYCHLVVCQYSKHAGQLVYMFCCCLFLFVDV